MMLKVLMLSKRLSDRKKALEELLKEDAELKKREADLKTAIEEASTDEEQKTVEEAVAAFETDKRTHEDARRRLETEIEELRKKIAEAEAVQNAVASADENRADGAAQNTENADRREGFIMTNRERFFGSSHQEVSALFARDDVRQWLDGVRAVMRRDVTNAKLLVPQVMLPILKQEIESNMVLLPYINNPFIPGEGRQVIDGGFPEAVWTAACGKINAVSFGYYDVAIDAHKVAGYIALCNATIEDSDINLAYEVITKLGQGIAYAKDKAVIYGTGVNMPLGIVTRLCQTEKPAGTPETARPWADLHTSNVLTISSANSTGAKLFQNLIRAFGTCKTKYSRAGIFWAMNETTRTTLVAEALGVNAAGAIVSCVDDTMPVLGGKIVILDFIPNNVIVAGYGKLYMLADRAGLKTAESEHALFTDDKTVFKATARADGRPVIPEAFVSIGINGVTVAANAVSFAPDTANAGE